MSEKLGDASLKKLTTGRLYFKRKNAGVLETNYTDLGNCVTGGYKPDVQRAEHMKSNDGYRRIDHTRTKSIKPLYSFEFDEHTDELERLRQLAGAGASATQAAATVTDEVLVTAGSVKGRTYFTTKLGLTVLTNVKVGVTVHTLGTDYVVDLGSGAITILPDSTIANGSTVTATYTVAQVITTQFTAFSDLLAEGDFIFDEDDQLSSVPRFRHTFSGQIYVSNWGDSGDDFNKTTIDCIPLTDPVIKRINR